MEEERIFEAKRKPRRCPGCGSRGIARIVYGLVPPTEELLGDLDAGKAVLGGCCITGRDPSWQCLDCEARIFRTMDQGS